MILQRSGMEERSRMIEIVGKEVKQKLYNQFVYLIFLWPLCNDDQYVMLYLIN